MNKVWQRELNFEYYYRRDLNDKNPEICGQRVHLLHRNTVEHLEDWYRLSMGSQAPMPLSSSINMIFEKTTISQI